MKNETLAIKRLRSIIKHLFTPTRILNFHIGYKNRKYNAKTRSTTAEITNFRLADGGANMAFERNMLDGYQRISNSIIIGESANLGSGQWIKVQTHKKYVVNIDYNDSV